MKVLIVEDDTRVSSFLDRGLKAEGYRPQVAHNASTGISMAKALQKEVRENFESAVVILDVMLPDGSGLDGVPNLARRRIRFASFDADCIEFS